MATLLHRDDGLAATATRGETLADLELRVFSHFFHSKGNVLDVGCGRGRGCVYLALQGNDVVGVEIDLPTLLDAKRLRNENFTSGEFVRADGRNLCFREGSFDYVISLASTLSEKHRLWLGRLERRVIISEAVRVARPGGIVLANFVHRYWSLRSFLGFMKNYLIWGRDKLLRRRTERGDYTETIGSTPVRFHAFTVSEAVSLFPRERVSVAVWRKKRRFFSDWFFLVGSKTG